MEKINILQKLINQDNMNHNNHQGHNHDQHNYTHHRSESPGGMFEVALKAKQEVADNTTAFFFEKPEGFLFKAGQHLNMKLINPPETDAEGNSRHFSLANSPAEKELLFATRIRNTAFKRVLAHLETGNKVAVEHIHGSFTLHDDASKPAVFLAGGIGITPAFSIIKDATERKLPHCIFLFYSNKRPEDAAFLTELEKLAKENPNFTFIPTMTESEKSAINWQGETGYIDRAMIERYVNPVREPIVALDRRRSQKLFTSPPTSSVAFSNGVNNLQLPIYYLAGPPGMVAAMQELLMTAGVNEDNIKTEKFTGY